MKALPGPVPQVNQVDWYGARWFGAFWVFESTFSPYRDGRLNVAPAQCRQWDSRDWYEFS